MIYPENYEQKSGFDRIRQMLLANCLSKLGQSFVDRIEFQTSFPTIEKLLLQVHEFKQILEFDEGFPSTAFHDLRQELSRLIVEGTYIEKETLVLLQESLTTIFECRNYLSKRKVKFPNLLKLGMLVELEPSLLKSIQSIIDEKGEIRDKASSELFELRKQIDRQKHSIDKNLARILSEAKKASYTNTDAEITIRNGRWVIPVIAQHKKRIRGIVHDESNTGQTLYIEPEEVFEESNYLLELQHAEKREIIKILLAYTNHLRPEIQPLLSAYRFLGLIDYIRAKALLAREMYAVMPFLEDKPFIDWKDAAHPLLYFSLKRQGKVLVTNSFQLNAKNRIMLISGPNAGGKSVCLKTLALLQYMLQCGLLIPVREDSKAGIFTDLFIDIGDEQSLESDLSTYSSHLKNIKKLLEVADERTLFFIDEFGSGTEPQSGGAIAESVLEALVQKKAQGIVTTHYANLKLLAAQTPGMINAAMTYDTRRMQPLFTLRTGKPGSSFAFEIASSTGLDAEILMRAAELTGKSQMDYETELMQLDLELESLRKKETEFRMADDFLDEVVQKYQNLYIQLEKQKNTVINDAKEQAKKILSEANKLIENTIRQIVESNADKEKTKLARTVFQSEKDKLTKDQPDLLKKQSIPEKSTPVEMMPQPENQPEELKPGDKVRISGNSMTGEVLSIKAEEVLVSYGSFTLKTSIDKVMRTDGREIVYKPAGSQTGVKMGLPEKMALFQSTLDLRGKRATEAISMLRTYFDDAMLLGIREVRILHGTGSGILRQVLREEIRSFPEVQSAGDEKVELGGSGITMVRFKY